MLGRDVKHDRVEFCKESYCNRIRGEIIKFFIKDEFMFMEDRLKEVTKAKLS